MEWGRAARVGRAWFVHGRPSQVGSSFASKRTTLHLKARKLVHDETSENIHSPASTVSKRTGVSRTAENQDTPAIDVAAVVSARSKTDDSSCTLPATCRTSLDLWNRQSLRALPATCVTCGICHPHTGGRICENVVSLRVAQHGPYAHPLFSDQYP